MVMASDGQETCDKYLVSHLNMTHVEVVKTMEEISAPMIMGRRFNPELIKNSKCVHIRVCAEPGSPPHRELMMAVRMQRSLSWNIQPCNNVPAGVQEQEKGWKIPV